MSGICPGSDDLPTNGMLAPPFRFITPMPRLATQPGWTSELRRIEALGFHSVAVSEHYSRGWAMDALTAMTYAIAQTNHLHAMPLVLANDLHHPAILAKSIATADVLSGGRVALGLGAGWLEDDYRALGVRFRSPGSRIERLDEALQVIAAFFADAYVSFQGDHYRLTGLEALPRPIRQPRPPILVGGGGPKILDLAGRRADIVGLHPRLGPDGFTANSAAGLSRASIDKKIGMIAAAAAEVGRATPDIQFSCYDVNIDGVQLTPVRPAFSDYIDEHATEFADSPISLRGDVHKCVDDLQRWREELGISYWHLGPDVDAVAPIVAQLAGT
jgi:probable F420-dependent oxidoreductase